MALDENKLFPLSTKFGGKLFVGGEPDWPHFGLLICIRDELFQFLFWVCKINIDCGVLEEAVDEGDGIDDKDEAGDDADKVPELLPVWFKNGL